MEIDCFRVQGILWWKKLEIFEEDEKILFDEKVYRKNRSKKRILSGQRFMKIFLGDKTFFPTKDLFDQVLSPITRVKTIWRRLEFALLREFIYL